MADYAVCSICPEEADKLQETRFLIKCQDSTTKLKRHLKASYPDIRVAEEEEKAIVILSDETSLKSMMSFLCDGTMNITNI